MKNEKLKKFLTSPAAKSIAVASCALMIGLAVYLNYRWFYDPTSSIGFGDNNMENNYSDSSTAGGNASDVKNDYFTKEGKPTLELSASTKTFSEQRMTSSFV